MSEAQAVELEMKPKKELNRSSQFCVAAGLILVMGLAFFDRQAAAAADELEYFHECVKQELPATLRRFVIANGPERLNRAEDSARADIVNSLFSICRQRALDSSHRVDERSYVDDTVGSFFKQIPGIVELQRQTEQLWKSNPDKAIEDQAVRAYSLCLEGTARRLARTSDDPTDTIEQGSLAACDKSRQIIFDTYSSHSKSYDPEAMKALEQEFHSKLPEVVTRTRNDVRKAKQQ
jgi:hypothetical protein